MSVVNQMLRDLDRRQASGEQKVFGQHVRRPSRRRGGLWLGAALFVVAAFGVVYLLQGGDFYRMSSAPQIAAATKIQAETAPVALAVAASPAVTPTAVSQNAPATISEPPAAPITPAVATVTSPPAEAIAVAATAAPPPSAEPPKEQPRMARASIPARDSRSDHIGVIVPEATKALDDLIGKIDKRFRETPGQSAEAEFRRAAALIEHGRLEDATTALRSAIAIEPGHEAARQALAVLLIDAKAPEEAERVLAEGLQVNPRQAQFAFVLARLRLDRGDTSGALALLREHAVAAAANPDYRAFMAALLQRLGHYGEAIEEYEAALRLAPGVGVWWIGLGLSREASDRATDAVEAFRRAKASGTLSTDLLDFVDRKLQTARAP